MDTIVGMRTFVAVARQRSFTAGAKQLEISTKLASKYVRQLEEKLGAQLFHRTTRSVTLTETGEAYFTRCVPLLEQFDELEGVVQTRQSTLAGSIRITAPTGFGSTHLVDAVSHFQPLHPDVTIQLQLADHYVPVVEEGFDLAIRFGPLNDSSLVARKLMDMRMVVAASPDYISRVGEPQRPADLSRHNCLQMRINADQSPWPFCVEGEPVSVRVSGSFHANSPKAIAQMGATGLGIVFCPYYAIKPYVETGKLRILFEEQEATVISLYAVYPQSRHLSARVRALIDHLVETFKSGV
ncbi:LysR family transcriptional regulator [Amphritea japonica]|uniref:LysR family transcriptional regulator n=1 Tax=Amphritea japonica ATCC BAA-1530 TaxID=1278309 RepID=A0A7R6P4H9_9GAMM|nr:LysR family transcriptional regulator [Amphritea japonica]BBB27153.1 LysR family transcriptional regulator [Amphritea japonica ATCC BAA-1530]